MCGGEGGQRGRLHSLLPPPPPPPPILPPLPTGMKVIRHAGVDSRMIILDDQAHQQMTLHFQLSLQCNVSLYA